MNRRAFLGVLLAACSKRAAPAPTETAAVSSAKAEPPPPSSAEHVETALEAGAPPASPFADALPHGGRSIGHTSVVFKLTFDGGLVAAYKPKTRRGPARFRGEIAAHRLGRALGLPNVPVASFRTFPANSLRSVLSASGAAELFDREVLEHGGSVEGALMPWIEGLEFVPLERDPWWSRWRAWLKKDGRIDDADRKLAAEISTMVVFDYVTGNFDRWSGGNVGRDTKTGSLLFIDNDGAFYETPHPGPLARQLDLLRSVDRFSTSLAASLEALTPEALARAMGETVPGSPLLSARALAGVDERRKIALREISNKTKFFA